MVLSFWCEFYGGECSFQELRREGKGPDTRAFGRHLSMANGGSVGKASDCHAGDPSCDFEKSHFFEIGGRKT